MICALFEKEHLSRHESVSGNYSLLGSSGLRSCRSSCFSIQVRFDCPQYFPASSVLSASSSGIQSSAVIYPDNIIAVLLFYCKVFLKGSVG